MQALPEQAAGAPDQKEWKSHAIRRLRRLAPIRRFWLRYS